MAAHRRATDTEDHVHERLSERQWVDRWGNRIDRIMKLAWPALSAFGVWFAATVWQPIRQVPQMTRDMKIVVEQIKVLNRNDSLSVLDRQELHDGQNVTNRILCFNLSRADRAKYNIDCSLIPLPED